LSDVTAARLISTDTRSALLVALGAALIAAPIAATLTVPAMVTGVVIGALVVGLGLAGTATGGRGTLPVAAQPAYDQGLGLGLVLSAAGFAAFGDTGALLLFGAAGLLVLAVTAVTRYSARPVGQNFL